MRCQDVHQAMKVGWVGREMDVPGTIISPQRRKDDRRPWEEGARGKGRKGRGSPAEAWNASVCVPVCKCAQRMQSWKAWKVLRTSVPTKIGKCRARHISSANASHERVQRVASSSLTAGNRQHQPQWLDMRQASNSSNWQAGRGLWNEPAGGVMTTAEAGKDGASQEEQWPTVPIAPRGQASFESSSLEGQIDN
jgi:hypothetical protein